MSKNPSEHPSKNNVPPAEGPEPSEDVPAITLEQIEEASPLPKVPTVTVDQPEVPSVTADQPEDPSSSPEVQNSDGSPRGTYTVTADQLEVSELTVTKRLEDLLALGPPEIPVEIQNYYRKKNKGNSSVTVDKPEEIVPPEVPAETSKANLDKPEEIVPPEVPAETSKANLDNLEVIVPPGDQSKSNVPAATESQPEVPAVTVDQSETLVLPEASAVAVEQPEDPPADESTTLNQTATPSVSEVTKQPDESEPEPLINLPSTILAASSSSKTGGPSKDNLVTSAEQPEEPLSDEPPPLMAVISDAIFSSFKFLSEVSTNVSRKNTAASSISPSKNNLVTSGEQQEESLSDEPPPLPESGPHLKGYEFSEAEQTLALAPDAVPGEDSEGSEPDGVPATVKVSEESTSNNSEGGSEGSKIMSTSSLVKNNTPSSFQLLDEDNPWILDKLYRKSAGTSSDENSSGGATASQRSVRSDGHFEGEGWILDKMYRRPGGASGPAPEVAPYISGSDTEPNPTSADGNTSQPLSLDTEGGNPIGEKDSGWILEKINFEGKSKKGGGGMGGERGGKGRGCLPDEDLNLSDLDPDRTGQWVLDKMRYKDIKRPGCEIKESNAQIEADQQPEDTFVNFNEASNQYEKDGQWVLEKMVLGPKKSKRTLGFANAISTMSMNCNGPEECYEDPKIKPFCGMVRSCLAIYDVLTACDTMACNECDPPGTEVDAGIFTWLSDIVSGLSDLVSNDVGSTGTSGNDNDNNNESCEVVTEPEPCS